MDNPAVVCRGLQDEPVRIDNVPDPEWLLDHVILPAADRPGHIGPIRGWRANWEAQVRKAAEAIDGSARGAAIALALRQGCVLTRADARRCEVDGVTWRREVRRGEWMPCGYGCVSVVPVPEGVDARYAERWIHTLRACGAVAKRREHSVAGRSAAVAHGLPLLKMPALPELFATGAATVGVLDAAHVRCTQLSAWDVDRWLGVPISTVARTIVDVARFDPRSGLIAADAALHEQLISGDELDWALERCAGLAGVRRAREVLALSSPLVESPLESLTHLALHDSGFPPPRLQFPVHGADGKRYRADFAWPDLRLLLEADGRRKYREDELWREKRREMALTRAGYRLVRVRWADVVHEWPETSAWLWELMSAHPSS